MPTYTFGALPLVRLPTCRVTTAGTLAIGRSEQWGTDYAVDFMSLAVGVLVSVFFIHIIPKSFGVTNAAPRFLLTGFLALCLYNHFLIAFVCHKYEYPDLSLGVTPMLGAGLPSYLDGVVYSVTFNVSIFTVVLAAIGRHCTSSRRASSRFCSWSAAPSRYPGEAQSLGTVLGRGRGAAKRR